jgi:hypothetical protein
MRKSTANRSTIPAEGSWDSLGLETVGSRLGVWPTERENAPETMAEMDVLYNELAVLTADANAASDRELKERIDARWSRLRELQEKEAQRAQEEFEASLSMPLDAGAKILAKARALRKELDDDFDGGLSEARREADQGELLSSEEVKRQLGLA